MNINIDLIPSELIARKNWMRNGHISHEDQLKRAESAVIGISENVKKNK